MIFAYLERPDRGHLHAADLRESRDLATLGSDGQLVTLAGERLADDAIGLEGRRIRQLAADVHRERRSRTGQRLNRADAAGHLERQIVESAVDIELQRIGRAAGAQRRMAKAEVRRLAGLAVAIGEPSIADVDLVHRRQLHCAFLGRLLRFRRRRFLRRGGDEFPVAAALLVGLQQDVGVVQDDALDVDVAEDQRQQLDLRLEALDLCHVRPRAPRRVGERYVVHGDGRRQAERQLQIAVDCEIAPRRLLDLRGDGAAILVEIHGRHDRDSGHDQPGHNRGTGNDDRSQAHAALLSFAFRTPGNSSKYSMIECAPAERSSAGG